MATVSLRYIVDDVDTPPCLRERGPAGDVGFAFEFEQAGGPVGPPRPTHRGMTMRPAVSTRIVDNASARGTVVGQSPVGPVRPVSRTAPLQHRRVSGGHCG
jgi:hypothetical protein